MKLAERARKWSDTLLRKPNRQKRMHLKAMIANAKWQMQNNRSQMGNTGEVVALIRLIVIKALLLLH